MTKIKVLGVLGLIFSSFAFGYHFNQLKVNSATLSTLKAHLAAEQLSRERLYRIGMETQKAVADIRVENRTIYQEVEREILRETIYKECVIPDEGLRLIREARQ